MFTAKSSFGRSSLTRRIPDIWAPLGTPTACFGRPQLEGLTQPRFPPAGGQHKTFQHMMPWGLWIHHENHGKHRAKKNECYGQAIDIKKPAQRISLNYLSTADIVLMPRLLQDHPALLRILRILLLLSALLRGLGGQEPRCIISRDTACKEQPKQQECLDSQNIPNSGTSWCHELVVIINYKPYILGGKGET